MENATALASAADSSDPRTGLRAVAALRRLLEQLEALQVDNARKHGWSWQEIAEILGVSRQAVHKKHARRSKPAIPPAAAPACADPRGHRRCSNDSLTGPGAS